MHDLNLVHHIKGGELSHNFNGARYWLYRKKSWHPVLIKACLIKKKNITKTGLLMFEGKEILVLKKNVHIIIFVLKNTD